MPTEITLPILKKKGYYFKYYGIITVNGIRTVGTVYNVILDGNSNAKVDCKVFKDNNEWVIIPTESDSSLCDEIKREIDKIGTNAYNVK